MSTSRLFSVSSGSGSAHLLNKALQLNDRSVRRRDTLDRMIDRADLEKPRTPSEMDALLRNAYEDRKSYLDESFYRREGVIKTLLEEYQPLATLAAYLGASSARLSPDSHPGADGVISTRSLLCHPALHVQITLAEQNHQQALGRELLARGEPHFPTTRKIRNKKTRGFEQEGRLLRPGGLLPLPTEEVVAAVARKATNFHPGTDVLLIGLDTRLDGRSDLTAWRRELNEQLVYPDSCPYDRVFLVSRCTVVEASPRARSWPQHLLRLARRLVRRCS